MEEAAAQDDKKFKESDLEQTAFVLVLARDSDFVEAGNFVFSDSGSNSESLDFGSGSEDLER